MSDKKIGVASTTNPNEIAYYTADVVTANDYYPDGMTMPGRKFAQGNSKYRYGFNGQMKSTEIGEESYTATYWEYDARTGRRWNVDPIVKSWESPYATFGGNPILNTDPDGADWYKNNKNGNVEYKANWHKKHKGYESLGKGNGDWLNYSGKDYNKKTGEVSTTLESVTVTGTRKTDNSLMARAYPHFKEITPANVKIWNEAQWLYNDRKNGGSQLIQGGESNYYTSHQNFLQSSYQAEKDYRNMQLAVVGIMAAPAVVGLAPEAFAATMTTRLVSVGGDATVQYVSNIPQYGFGINNVNQMNITSLGGSFLAPGSAFMSSFIGNGFSYSIGGGYGGTKCKQQQHQCFFKYSYWLWGE